VAFADEGANGILQLDQLVVEGFETKWLRNVANQLLYAIQRRTFVTRLIHQQETKAAAFVVCEALGIDSKTAFADCQLYHGDARLLAESLQVVHRAAAVILGAINHETAMPANSAQGVN